MLFFFAVSGISWLGLLATDRVYLFSFTLRSICSALCILSRRGCCMLRRCSVKCMLEQWERKQKIREHDRPSLSHTKRANRKRFIQNGIWPAASYLVAMMLAHQFNAKMRVFFNCRLDLIRLVKKYVCEHVKEQTRARGRRNIQSEWADNCCDTLFFKSCNDCYCCCCDCDICNVNVFCFQISLDLS